MVEVAGAADVAVVEADDAEAAVGEQMQKPSNQAIICVASPITRTSGSPSGSPISW